jgi:hypothetical protein
MCDGNGRFAHVTNTASYDLAGFTSFHFHLAWWAHTWGASPHGSVVHPFGNDEVDSADGWQAHGNTRISIKRGHIEIVQAEPNDLGVKIKSPLIGRVGLLTSKSLLQLKGSFSTKKLATVTLSLSDSTTVQSSSWPVSSIVSRPFPDSISFSFLPLQFGAETIRVKHIVIALQCSGICILDEFRWQPSV